MNSQTLRSGIAASTCVVCGIAVSVAVGVVPRAAGEDNIRLVSAVTASATDASLAQLLYPTQPSHVQAPYRAAPVSHAVTKSAPAVHTAVAHATAAHVVSAVATTATPLTEPMRRYAEEVGAARTLSVHVPGKLDAAGMRGLARGYGGRCVVRAGRWVGGGS